MANSFVGLFLLSPLTFKKLGLVGRLTHTSSSVSQLEDDLSTTYTKPFSLILSVEERSWEYISFLFCTTRVSFHMSSIGYSRLW